MELDGIFGNIKDRLHRYFLERVFSKGDRTINFCMLNPSIADEIQNDPTVRRCIGYAKCESLGL